MTRDVNLVLEGGGVKGIALAGAITELTRRHYCIKRVAGASVGAIVAALVAADKAAETQELMSSFPFTAMRSTGRLRAGWSLLTRGGQFPVTPLHGWLNQTLEGMTFRELRDDATDHVRTERRYKLVVTATDVTRGELVHLPWDYERLYGLDPDRQLVADAVCASAAFPFFFVPQTIECRPHGARPQRAGRMTSTLIDGGVLSNFPIELFHEHDAGHGVDNTIGVKIMPHLPTPPGDTSVVWTPNTHLRPLRLVEQMVGTMVAGRDQARLEHPSVARRVIHIDTSAASILDFGITADAKNELFRNGRDATAAFLDDWERSCPVSPTRTVQTVITAPEPITGTTPMTAAVRVPRRNRWHLRMWLFLGKMIPSAELANLSFIHVATWSVVRRRHRPWDGHLVFISNFSGDSDEYIANFCDVVPVRITRSFGWSEGFPGAQPSVDFIAYERSHDYAPSVYYSAFQAQTVRDIAMYVRVAKQVELLCKAAKSNSVQKFCAAYNNVLTTAHERDPGRITVRQRVAVILAAWRPGRRMHSVTAILPLKKDEKDSVDRALKALEPVVKQVFDAVTGTHFARFVKLPGTEPDSLLFSAQVDGRAGPYLGRLRDAIGAHPELREVFGCCEGYPRDGRRRLRRWLGQYLVPAQLLIAANPRVTVDAILEAKDLTPKFLDFATDHQGLQAAALLAAFRADTRWC